VKRVEFESNGQQFWYDHEEFIAQKEFMRRKEIELMPPWLVRFMIDVQQNEKRTTEINRCSDIL